MNRRKKGKRELFAVDQLTNDEWLEWYRLTPADRWDESLKLWETFLWLGGSLEAEPDTQSPFYDPEERCSISSYGGAGVRVLRRGGV